MTLSGKDEFPFYIEKDGGIDIRWAEPGSSEYMSEYPDWIGSSSSDIYDEDWVNVIGKYYTIRTTLNNTTGNARSIDMIIVPYGKTEEFFRFKITQTAE